MWPRLSGGQPVSPPFDATHSHLLTQHAPLTQSFAYWVPPLFVDGQNYASPVLKALLQEVVDRPGWSSNRYLGLIVDGSPSLDGDLRTVRTHADGKPAKLKIEFLPPLR